MAITTRIELTRIAIWRPANNLEVGAIHKGVSPANSVNCLPKGGSIFQNNMKPLFRYVKNYEVGKGNSKVGFALFVRTMTEDDKSVEKQLDAVAKKITKDEAQAANANPNYLDFQYLNEYLKEKE